MRHVASIPGASYLLPAYLAGLLSAVSIAMNHSRPMKGYERSLGGVEFMGWAVRRAVCESTEAYTGVSGGGGGWL
jgi:hypothetical protein